MQKSKVENRKAERKEERKIIEIKSKKESKKVSRKNTKPTNIMDLVPFFLLTCFSYEWYSVILFFVFYSESLSEFNFGFYQSNILHEAQL